MVTPNLWMSTRSNFSILFLQSHGTISLKHVILCSGKNFKCACPQGMLPMDNHAHECMWPEGEQVCYVEFEILLPTSLSIINFLSFLQV